MPSRFRSSWLAAADRRYGPVRGVVEQCVAVAQDLGGFDQLSRVQRDLVLRYSFVSQQLEATESEAVQGKPIDAHLYLARLDRAMRLTQIIGVARREREVPDLHAYLEAMANAKSEGGDA